MTKTAARRLAKRQVSYGYHQPDTTTVYVRCPKCATRRTVTVAASATPSHRCRALEAELVEHLTFTPSECGANQPREVANP